MKQLILASQSPSRKQLLEFAGVEFTVEPSNYEEDMSLEMTPAELAKYLSAGKARDVAAHRKNAVILGADSFAVYEGELLGKPHTFERAKEVLTMLSGKSHDFLTGFTIIDADTGEEYSEVVKTKVYFKTLTSDEIDNYLAKEDVRKNAGSYRSQELGSVLVEKMEGSATNIVGLPMSQVATALKKFGIIFI